MHRKIRMIGGSLISTVQVRALSSYPKSAAEQHMDLPTTTLVQIRQFYRRHASLCDGEKFLHIRFYEREKNYAVASKWERLLGAKAKSLHQVLRNEWLRDCLEKLEPFRSLWIGLQLGSFPLILSWRCRQEVEYYLGQMYEIWYTITGGDAYLCDEYTVEKLGGLAPLWSSRDRSIIETLFATHQIFPRAHDPAVRAQILQKVLAVGGLILTFQTFFKHVKILGPVMLPLRELFPTDELCPPRDEFSPVSRRLPSVRDILLQHYYERPEQNNQECLLQYSEHDERFFECSDPGLYSYWQLCLYLFRHAQGHWYPRKEKQTQAQSPERPGWVIRLGQFARRLGFESDRISSLCNQDADLSQIRIHMLQERPSVFFFAPADKFDVEAHSRQKGQVIFEPRPPAPTPLMTTDSATTTRVPRNHPQVFLPTIWSALTQEPRYALTEYGELVLVSMSFFEKFGSSPVQGAHGGFQPARPLLRSSSIYSVPAYPKHTARLHGASITFWHLPRSRDMYPLAKYSCDATKEGVKKVVNSIRAQGIAPLFALVDRDGRLKLCDASQIMYRRKQSKKSNDVYYIYSDEDYKIWIMKKLDSYQV
ncbi:DUF3723 domain-containing protein [Pyrenophora tritici-repentis]|nr:DUF3723 domain-containing protein [Pyrenophora tritici-repentis]